MSDYIKKETMRRIIREQEHIHGIRGAGWIELAMDREKPVDVDTVGHGRWVTWEEILHVDKRAPNNLGVFCSMCNKHSDNMTNYCPVCGAEMDGGEKNEDIPVT